MTTAALFAEVCNENPKLSASEVYRKVTCSSRSPYPEIDGNYRFIRFPDGSIAGYRVTRYGKRVEAWSQNPFERNIP